GDTAARARAARADRAPGRRHGRPVPRASPAGSSEAGVAGSSAQRASVTEKLTIDTPEQIALELPLAGVGSRFLALAIDTIIQALAFAALIVAGAGLLRAIGRISESTGLWGCAL